MTIYQYDMNGYYVGSTTHYGGPLPSRTTAVAPEVTVGYIPHWNGSGWEQVENHKGEQGYVNGKPFTIVVYGPYPDGWSTTQPSLSHEERLAQAKAPFLAEQAEIRENYVDALLDGSEPRQTALSSAYAESKQGMGEAIAAL